MIVTGHPGKVMAERAPETSSTLGTSCHLACGCGHRGGVPGCVWICIGGLNYNLELRSLAQEGKRDGDVKNRKIFSFFQILYSMLLLVHFSF